MLFLHLSCKKENFLPFTTWLLLSSFGVLLASNVETLTYLIKQPQANNIVKMNTLDLQNKYHLNVSKNKKLVTLHTNSILPINIVQDILTLNPFLITSIMICTRFEHLQTQYFTNKRAPPLT
nr:hypothetical protein [Bartonella sp. ML70XJBT.G]